MDNNIQREYKSNLLWLSLLSLIAFLNYFFGNDFMALAATGLSCLYVVICDESYLLPSMMFMNSFAYLFRFNQFSLYAFVCLAFILRSGLKEKRRITNALIVGIPYLFLHLFSTNILRLSFADIVPFILLLTLYFAACEYTSNERDAILSYFAIGHAISTFWGFFKSFTRLDSILGQDYVSAVSWADTTRFSGISFDPNFYTLMAIIVLCVLAFSLHDKLPNAVWIPLFITTLVGGALTFSKSFYLCAIILLGYFIVARVKRVSLGEIRMAIIAALLCYIFRDKIINVIDIFLKRFDSSDSLDGLTTGRWSTWGNYISQIKDSFYTIAVGHGILSGGMKAAHNLFLEMLYKFGALGTLFDALYLVLCNKEMKIRTKRKMMSVLVIALYASLLFNLSAYSFAGFWATVFVVMLVVSDDIQYEETV